MQLAWDTGSPLLNRGINLSEVNLSKERIYVNIEAPCSAFVEFVYCQNEDWAVCCCHIMIKESGLIIFYVPNFCTHCYRFHSAAVTQVWIRSLQSFTIDVNYLSTHCAGLSTTMHWTWSIHSIKNGKIGRHFSFFVFCTSNQYWDHRKKMIAYHQDQVCNLRLLCQIFSLFKSCFWWTALKPKGFIHTRFLLTSKKTHKKLSWPI